MTAGEEAEAGPWGDEGSTGRVEGIFRHAVHGFRHTGPLLGPDVRVGQCLLTS